MTPATGFRASVARVVQRSLAHGRCAVEAARRVGRVDQGVAVVVDVVVADLRGVGVDQRIVVVTVDRAARPADGREGVVVRVGAG